MDVLYLSAKNYRDIILTSIIIISIIYSLEFSTSALADGFSLEFQWQQVFSGLPESSQYSGRPQ